jgi:hypothetical protein
MAQIVLLNPQIIINSVDLSGRIDQVTIEMSYADLDTTTFGNTSKTRVAGLGDHKVTLEFQQDESASSVEATIFPLIGQPTTVSIKPVSGATTTTNPAYSFTASVQDWKPLDGKVGDIVKSSITWPISGDVTKATS